MLIHLLFLISFVSSPFNVDPGNTSTVIDMDGSELIPAEMFSTKRSQFNESGILEMTGDSLKKNEKSNPQLDLSGARDVVVYKGFVIVSADSLNHNGSNTLKIYKSNGITFDTVEEIQSDKNLYGLFLKDNRLYASVYGTNQLSVYNLSLQGAQLIISPTDSISVEGLSSLCLVTFNHLTDQLYLSGNLQMDNGLQEFYKIDNFSSVILKAQKCGRISQEDVITVKEHKSLIGNLFESSYKIMPQKFLTDEGIKNGKEAQVNELHHRIINTSHGSDNDAEVYLNVE